jgi:hypothetical protein
LIWRVKEEGNLCRRAAKKFPAQFHIFSPQIQKKRAANTSRIMRGPCKIVWQFTGKFVVTAAIHKHKACFYRAAPDLKPLVFILLDKEAQQQNQVKFRWWERKRQNES